MRYRNQLPCRDEAVLKNVKYPKVMWLWCIWKDRPSYRRLNICIRQWEFKHDIARSSSAMTWPMIELLLKCIHSNCRTLKVFFDSTVPYRLLDIWKSLECLELCARSTLFRACYVWKIKEVKYVIPYLVFVASNAGIKPCTFRQYLQELVVSFSHNFPSFSLSSSYCNLHLNCSTYICYCSILPAHFHRQAGTHAILLINNSNVKMLLLLYFY